jgi:hypothetical protein
MLITFFDIKDTVHCEFNPTGYTVNQAYYAEMMKWLYDNAPAHKILSVKQFLFQKSITEMEHPPYSPDLALNWLFPKIKPALKG